MRNSTEPKYRKYVEGYGFLPFSRKFGDRYGKKLMDTATKTGIDTSKTALKRVVQNTTEATGDLIENKFYAENKIIIFIIKITSLGKKRVKKKNMKDKKLHITRKKTTNY